MAQCTMQINTMNIGFLPPLTRALSLSISLSFRALFHIVDFPLAPIIASMFRMQTNKKKEL